MKKYIVELTSEERSGLKDIIKAERMAAHKRRHARILLSYDLGEEPIWSPNGDELFYRSVNKWMVVSITTEPEFKAGTPQVVFEGPYINVSGLSYDVAPDGQRFLVLQSQYDDSQIRELQVVTNWFEELKQLVPSPEAP